MCTDVTTTRTYYGSLAFNLGAFLLPALYATLGKLWIAHIDRSEVVTTDIYGYIGVVVEILNEGLPRAAWVIIADKSSRSIRSRISLANTMIVFQISMGFIVTLLISIFAHQFASAFVPLTKRETSLTYIRISSLSALSSAMEASIAVCTRALDRPNVPLWISSMKFVVNILLDILLISKFNIGLSTPTVITQALIRMVCDLSSALFGLLYFLYIFSKLKSRTEEKIEGIPKPSLSCLKILTRPAVYTFAESAIRNVIYLWLMSGIMQLGSNYATAWGVFMTIRWGIVMVPVQALEASALTFVGHKWGQWRAETGAEVERPKATNKELFKIARPALLSTSIALVIEILMCVLLSFWGAKSFGFFLSQSEEVAGIVEDMWKTIDWCYILYAISYEMGSILLATIPRLYLLQGLVSNLFWMLPWTIIVNQVNMTPLNAWSYHSLIFGGALVVNFVAVLSICLLWGFLLKKGWIRLSSVNEEV